MYSNMLAVLFLFQHTFFSIPVVFSHSSLPLPAFQLVVRLVLLVYGKALSDFLFCLSASVVDFARHN